MSRLLRDIIRLALVVMLPLLLALAPAMAQTVVYQNESTTLAVVQVPGDTYEWEIYSDGTVNFAKVSGNCPATSADFVGVNTGASVNVKWFKPGTYFFKVTAHDATNCTMNLKIGIIVVKEALPTAIISPPTNPICTGDTAPLEVTLTGTGPWSITYTDGTNVWKATIAENENKYTIFVKPNATTNYWITEVKDQSGTNSVPSTSVELQVNPKPAMSKITSF